MATGNVTLTVGPAPHRRAALSISKINYAQILLLAPTVLAGAIGHAFGDKETGLDQAFGPMNEVIRALAVALGLDSSVLWLFGIVGTVALAMGAGMFIEYAVQVFMRQSYRATDGHGALVGMLVALLMPPTVPWWLLLLGVALAIFLGKQVFGGLGGYPMHPAAVGWLILLLSWPNYVTTVGSASIAAPNEAAVIVTLAGGLVLWAIGAIRPQIVIGTFAGVILFALLFKSRLGGGMLDQVLTGHVVLGAFFMATDSTCSPANRRAMWLYGFGTGFLIILIRAFGVWHDSVPFAILLMNVVAPLLDRMRPRVQGVVAS